MKILVPIKRVIDYNVHIRIKEDHSGVETDNVKMSMNPFDEIAVEEAIQLKEKNIATEVIIVSIGNQAVSETIRTSLAMGADRGIHVISADASPEPLSVAKILHKIAIEEDVKLVIAGKQAIDDDCNQCGQMLAGLLNWGQGSFISKLKIENNKALVTREIDEGLEILSLDLPCVLTVDLRLNTPRYASLPNIMKARSKPIKKIELDDNDLQKRMRILEITPPENRKGGIKVKDVNELLDKLTNEVKVI